MSLVVWIRVIRTCGIAWPGDPTTFMEVLRYAVKSHAANVAGSLNQSLDQLLLGTFLGVKDLGLYSLAVNFTNLLSPFVNGASVGVLPQLSSEAPADRAASATRMIRSAAALIITGSLVLLAGTPLIPLVYGKAFGPAIGMALILLPGVLLRGISTVLTKVVLAYNKPLKASALELVGLIVTAIALAALLPSLKGYGASIASTLAYTTGFIIALRLVAKLITMPMRVLINPISIAADARQAFLRRMKPATGTSIGG